MVSFGGQSSHLDSIRSAFAQFAYTGSHGVKLESLGQKWREMCNK